MSTVDTANVIGAVIFFGYIVAALFFTGLIAHDLVCLYYESSNARRLKTTPTAKPGRRSRAQIFVALAVVSFATLSYHMLSFLIQSYSKWSQLSKLPLPKTLIGEEGILNFGGKHTTLHLWSWSTGSTLFQTFAETIVNNQQRYWWTQQALLYSLAWNIFMAVEGTRRQIPRLWAFFVLDQILPVSFVQNLFSAAIFMKAQPQSAMTFKSAPPGDQFIVTFLYLIALSAAPGTIGSASFSFLIFTLRGLLFAPYWMMRPSASSSAAPVESSLKDLYWQYRYSLLTLAVGGMFLHIRQTQNITSIEDAVRAVMDDSAVSALGYDYVLGVASLVTFVILW